jgi:hypothetical protein
MRSDRRGQSHRRFPSSTVGLMAQPGERTSGQNLTLGSRADRPESTQSSRSAIAWGCPPLAEHGYSGRRWCDHSKKPRLIFFLFSSRLAGPFREWKGRDSMEARSMAFEIWINRVYAHPQSIVGVLYANNNQLCYSLELPWKDNQNNISCVPVGSYRAITRADGNLGWRIELLLVPNRTRVELHVGNYPSNSIGCVLLGMAWAPNSVTSSVAARIKLKQAYEDAGSPSGIMVKIDGYP